MDAVNTKRGLGSLAYQRLKPAWDVSVAGVLLILATPIMLVLAALVRIDSPGPAIFRQKRVGKDGRLFTLYKFRTMCVDAPEYSFKLSDNHPSVTRLGRLLRPTCLDELPQLINVVKRDMNLVGPRPEQPFIVDRYEPWQRRRLSVMPGVTGWWQIHIRDGTPMHENVELDLYYIDNQSFGLDMYIAWRTNLFVARSFVAKLLRGCSAVLSRTGKKPYRYES